jgi:hypothetical protein
MLVDVKIADLHIGAIYYRKNDKRSLWRKVDNRQHETVLYDSMEEKYQYSSPCITEDFNPNEVVTVPR